MSALRDWAKLDTRWYEEPDLLAATETAPEAFAMWPVLIAKAKAESSASRNPDGTVRIAPRSLAFDAQCAQDRIGAALDAMAAEGLIRYTAEGTKELLITLNGFAKWQSPKGSNADRQARKRDKKASISGDNNGADTLRHAATQNDPQDVDVDVDKNNTSESAAPTSDHADILDVFEHWVEATWTGRGRRPCLDDKKRNRIRARLKRFTASELKTAIDGFAASPFHNGQQNGVRHLKLSTVLRDDEQVETGIEKAVAATNTAAAGDDRSAALLAYYQNGGAA
jgi:hypothetical protein